jgi:hypothetical protein
MTYTWHIKMLLAWFSDMLIHRFWQKNEEKYLFAKVAGRPRRIRRLRRLKPVIKMENMWRSRPLITMYDVLRLRTMTSNICTFDFYRIIETHSCMVYNNLYFWISFYFIIEFLFKILAFMFVIHRNSIS